MCTTCGLKLVPGKVIAKIYPPRTNFPKAVIEEKASVEKGGGYNWANLGRLRSEVLCASAL